MPQVPKKVADRMIEGLKKFQPILASARDRDVNEANTVVIVTDMLSYIFGYDKYSEITTEHNIRGTFCDLAIVIEKELRFIIEVKAIGLELKEIHVRQAVDYAAHEGVNWAILTNGIIWRIYRVFLGKTIEQELVIEFNVLDLNPKNFSDLETLFLIAREGLNKSALSEYQTQLQATNRFTLAATIISEPVLKVIRKSLKQLSPDISVSIEEIQKSLVSEVLKREVVEGEEADEAAKKIKKALKKIAKQKSSSESGGSHSENGETAEADEADEPDDAPVEDEGKEPEGGGSKNQVL